MVTPAVPGLPTLAQASTPPSPAMRGPEVVEFLQRVQPLNPPWTRFRLYKYAKAGVIPHLRIGQALHFIPEQLLAWLQSGGSGYAHGWRRKPGPKPGPKPKGKRAARGRAV